MKIEKWMDPREDIEVLTRFKNKLESSVIHKNFPLYKSSIKKLNHAIKQLEKQKKQFEKEGLI